MLQYGTKITQLNDPLQKIDLERLYLGIHKPKPEFRDLVEQLRAIAALDEHKYRELKKQLPYFVCGIFHPPVRRKENFAAIRYFIIDLDHLDKAGVEPASLRARLREDDEVALFFASPGGDGLKVLFRLAEDCRDAALFSAFYKIFARRFADRYQVQGAIDLRTHDVTRACFLSYDPEAYYNPISGLIRMEDYVKGLDFEQAEKEVKEAEKALKESAPDLPVKDKAPELDSDILSRIKQKLNPNQRSRPQKDYFVPAQLDEALPLIEARLAELEMTLEQKNPIGYGRQLRIRAGIHFAEVNIFYGQRGYSVVKTTKTGSHPELADLAAKAISEVLFPEKLN